MKISIMKGRLLVVATAILSLTLLACSAEDGEDGPVGPQGPAGNANVEAYTYTTNNSDWISSSQGAMWTATLTATGITQEVFDAGTAQMFIQDSDGWNAMPFSFANIEYNFAYDLQTTKIFVTSGSGGAVSNPGGQSFKLVIIPPSNLVKNINHNDYKVLQEVYGIE